MSDGHEFITANSLEDVMAGAMWVTALTDASLSADRLHETFMEVIFQFIPEDEQNEQTREQEEQQLQLRTAAERERERRHKEQLRREMRELQARPEDGNDLENSNNNRENEEEYYDDEEEEEEFDDEFDERGMNAQDQEFLDWIDVTQRFPARSSAEIVSSSETQLPQHGIDGGESGEVESSTAIKDERTRVGDEFDRHEEQHSNSIASEQMTGMSAIELELGNLGLGVEEEAAATDTLPERLRRIAQREHRPRLQSKILPCGFTYTIAMEHEAYWILRQLRNAGQPLAHNTIICALANRAQHEIAHEPILAAIQFALQKMTREFMEPAYLMLYHQTELHPLLRALLEHSSLLESAEHTLAVPSYAYSKLTGRRQRPYLSDDYVGFSAWSTRSIGEGDFAWNSINHNKDYTQRKPCMIELGRLLIRILELDALCHRLEYRRQQLLIMLHDSPESRVQDQRTLLSSIVFESIAEADVWHTFTQFLTNGRTSGAFHRVRELGLEESFEEYTITGLQFQENLLVNRALNVCMTPQIPLMEWANQIGRTLRPVRYGEDILTLFNAAIVDQFVRLPILCKQVIDLFCSEGDLIVTYRWVERADDVYPLASFFVEYPRHYLELLQMERQGTIGLYYVLDVHLVRSVLNLHSLYQHRAHNELAQEWNQSREMAMETLAIRLIDSLIPKVKAELHQQALYHMHVDCVERLALLCAEGPYETTYLCLEEYSDEVLTWEPSWNVVEALPLRKRHENTTSEVEQEEEPHQEEGNNGETHEEHNEEPKSYNENDDNNYNNEFARRSPFSSSSSPLSTKN